LPDVNSVEDGTLLIIRSMFNGIANIKPQTSNTSSLIWQLTFSSGANSIPISGYGVRRLYKSGNDWFEY